EVGHPAGGAVEQRPVAAEHGAAGVGRRRVADEEDPKAHARRRERGAAGSANVNYLLGMIRVPKSGG
ncbi:MAG: hypothetical protein JWQ18_3379, partial [Conexibacter sp.]|nr:hypothetical protein [Conexibacter sp.]